MELDVLRDRWAAARAGLYELFVEMENTPYLDFTPFEGARDIRGILRHIAHEEEIEVTWGARRAADELPQEPADEDYPTLEDIRALLEEVHAGTEEYVEALSQDDLDAELETAWEEQTRLGDLLWHVLEHEIHQTVARCP